MRDPKVEELNEDLKIDALKNSIMQTISTFQLWKQIKGGR